MAKRMIMVEFDEDAIPLHEADSLEESLTRSFTRAIDEGDHDSRAWLTKNVIGIESIH